MPRKPTSPIDEELRWQNVGRKLLLAFEAFEERIVSGIRAQGFRDFKSSDGSALRNIDVGGTRLSEVARRALMTKQGIGQLVADLESRGYLRCVPDPADRRAKLVDFTARGRRLIAAGQEVYAELEREWRELLGKRGFDRLDRLLGVVLAATREPKASR